MKTEALGRGNKKTISKCRRKGSWVVREGYHCAAMWVCQGRVEKESKLNASSKTVARIAPPRSVHVAKAVTGGNGRATRAYRRDKVRRREPRRYQNGRMGTRALLSAE